MWWLIYWLKRKPELLIVTDVLFLNLNSSIVYQKKKKHWLHVYHENSVIHVSKFRHLDDIKNKIKIF